MNSSGKILVSAGTLSLGALSGLFIWAAIDTSTLTSIGLQLENFGAETTGKITFAALGTTCLICAILLILGTLGVGTEKEIVFESDGGEMVIDLSALQDCVSRTLVEDEDVANASVKIRAHRGGMSKPIICDLIVDIHERGDIPAKGAEISEAARRRFMQVIPVEEDPIINVRIKIVEPKHDTQIHIDTQMMSTIPGLPGLPGIPKDAELPASLPTNLNQKRTTPIPTPPLLPDVPSFTGEIRYGAKSGKDEDEK